MSPATIKHNGESLKFHDEVTKKRGCSKPEGNEKIDDKKGAEVKTHDERQAGGGINPPPAFWAICSAQPLLRLHRLSVRK